MIVKPTQGKIVPQTSRSILNWLMDKAAAADDGTQQFSGRLPHEAVAQLVSIINNVREVERTEVAIDGGTLYNYNFMIVHTIKGRFQVSISQAIGRQPGDRYQVDFSYQAFTFEELLDMRGIKCN